MALTVAGVMFFSLAIVSVQQWGAGASSTMAERILVSQGCAQPCWHGIQPGKTTFQQGLDLLEKDTKNIGHLGNGQQDHIAGPEKNLCWLVLVNPNWHGCASNDEFADGPIQRIDLLPSPTLPMRLGEALTIFGTPVASTVCLTPGAEYAALYFPNDISVITLIDEAAHPALDPNTAVYVVRFDYPSTEPPYRFDTPPWRGFIQWHGQPVC